MLPGLAEKDQGKLDEPWPRSTAPRASSRPSSPRGRRSRTPTTGTSARALYLRTQALCDKSDWPKALESVKEFLVYFPDGDKKG